MVGGASQPPTALNNNNKRNDTNRNHSFPTIPATENVPRNFDDASSRTDDATAPSTASAANTPQLTMKRRNGGLAFATTHQANVATLYVPEHSTQANTTTINENSHERTTSISDWLMDSGCTAHMSNCFEDFIGPLEPYETLVEVANGGVIHVSHRGKTKVYIRDIFRRNHSVVAILNKCFTYLDSRDGSSPSSSGTHAADIFHFFRTGSVSRYSMKTETSRPLLTSHHSMVLRTQLFFIPSSTNQSPTPAKTDP
jgi:hypothetical protein